ncbi:MAG: hypothetical protein IJW67_04435 [Blautia sp.]|nr:hypothetical protein [Blautia sp.]
MKKTIYYSTIPKILVLLSTGYATLMMLHWPIGFTFFTQLSNLYCAAAAGCQLLILLKKNKESRSAGFSACGYREHPFGEAIDRPLPYRRILYIWKYTAVVSILLTFLVYLCILAPMMPGGILHAYTQDHCASLCMHILTPSFMLIDFFLNDSDYDWSTVRSFIGLVPPFCYLIFLLLLGQCGFRWGGDMMAPYLFLNYGAPAGWFGYMPETAGYTSLGIGVFYLVILLILLVWLLGALILRIAVFFQHRKTTVRHRL